MSNVVEWRYGVYKVSTLGLDKDDQVKQMMEICIGAVKDIMMRKKWRIIHLSEFIPKSPRLLGVNTNHGLDVRIRFRASKNSLRIFSLQDVLGTLLHELVHNDISPHDKKFYALLKTITNDCEFVLTTAFAQTSLENARNFLVSQEGGVSYQPQPKPKGKPRKPKGPFKGRGRKLGGDLSTFHALSKRELVS